MSFSAASIAARPASSVAREPVVWPAPTSKRLLTWGRKLAAGRPVTSTAHWAENGQQPLAHLGEAGVEIDDAVRLHDQTAFAEFDRAVAEPGILQAAGDADRTPRGARRVIGRLDRQQGFLGADRFFQDLSGRRQVADPHDVAPAHLPAVDADLGGEQVETAFDGEARLVDAEAAHRAARRIVGVGGDRLDGDRRRPVGPAGVAGGALQHLAADRSVGAGIAENIRLHRGQAALRVAADRIGHGQRMALGMDADRLLAGERDPHRPPGQARQQRRLRLDRHVLLAAERAAVGRELDVQPLFRLAEHGGDLPAILEDPLALAVDVQAAVGQRARQARLRLEEQMLDALRRPCAADHMGRGGQGGLDVAARVARRREQVVMLGVDARRAGLQRFGGVEHGGQRLVFDLDQLDRLARDARGFGGDRGEHVADAARLFALGDETGPVLVDLADPALARHVLGGGDRDDAGQRARPGDVDLDDAGARMRRQRDDAIEQAGRVDVGDERPLAERQFGPLIALERLADAAVLDHGRRRAAELGRLDEFDRVDDLGVTSAAAEMPVEHAGDFGARELLALIGHPFDPQDDARRAEPALQPGGGLKGVGIEAPLVLGDAFKRGDRTALDLLDPDRAGHFRLAVDQRQAGAAFALRRAARFERLELEGLAQHVEQRLVRPSLDLAGLAVELEFDRPHRSPAARAIIHRDGPAVAGHEMRQNLPIGGGRPAVVLRTRSRIGARRGGLASPTRHEGRIRLGGAVAEQIARPASAAGFRRRQSRRA